MQSLVRSIFIRSYDNLPYYSQYVCIFCLQAFAVINKIFV